MKKWSIVGICLIGLFPFASSADTVTATCQGIFTQEAYELFREVLQWFYILAPILLLLFIAVDYGKALLSQDDKEIKKVTSKVMKRIIATFLVFLVPFLVNLLLGMPAVQENLGDVGLVDDSSCYGETRYSVVVRKSTESGTSQPVDMVLTPSFDYAEVKLPNGTVVKNGEEIKYTATQNGTYIYTFYDEKGEEITQIRYLVGNIDTTPPEGSCVYEKDTITVTAKDESGILGYSYYNGSSYTSFIANHSSRVGKKIETPKVKVKDKVGNVKELTCEISKVTTVYQSPGGTNYVEQEYIDGLENVIDLSSYKGYVNNSSYFYLTNYDDRNSSTFQKVHGIDLKKSMKRDKEYGWWVWNGKIAVAAATNNLAGSNSKYNKKYSGFYYFTLPKSGNHNQDDYPQAYMLIDNKWFEVIVIDSCGGCMDGKVYRSKTYQQFDVLMDYDSDTNSQYNYMKRHYSKYYSVFAKLGVVKTVLVK